MARKGSPQLGLLTWSAAGCGLEAFGVLGSRDTAGPEETGMVVVVGSCATVMVFRVGEPNEAGLVGGERLGSGVGGRNECRWWRA